MGLINTKNSVSAVNYDCEVCMKTGKEPNLAGRFFYQIMV